MKKSITGRIAHRLELNFPHCNFELSKGVHDIHLLGDSIIYRLKHPEDGYVYDQSNTEFISAIWDYFETHFYHLLCQIRFVLKDGNNDYWLDSFSLHYSISQSIVLETHILRAILAVINGDSGETPFFADKRDLLIYYSKTLQKELDIECIIGDEKIISEKWPLGIHHDTGESDDDAPNFGKLVYFDINEATSASKTMKDLVGSELSFLLSALGLATDCDYYLTKDSTSIIKHISSIRDSWDYKKTKKRILERSKSIYDDLLSKFILNHGQIADTQATEMKRVALQNALREKWPETYKSYEENYHLINIENHQPGQDGMKEWMRKFMRNTYVGEQRDEEGNLIDVKIDETGRTTIESKSGWKRWIELVTIASISKEVEEKSPEVLQGQEEKSKPASNDEDLVEIHVEPNSDKDSLPEELRSKKADEIKEKLITAGVLDANWQPINLSRSKKGELARQLAIRLNINNVWKLFGKLWKFDSEQLRTAFNQGRNQKQNLQYQDEIQKILS